MCCGSRLPPRAKLYIYATVPSGLGGSQGGPFVLQSWQMPQMPSPGNVGCHAFTRSTLGEPELQDKLLALERGIRHTYAYLHTSTMHLHTHLHTLAHTQSHTQIPSHSHTLLHIHTVTMQSHTHAHSHTFLGSPLQEACA